MNAAAAPLPRATPTDAPADAACDTAWACGVLRGQVEMLQRLAEGGMRIAGAIERQATGAEADPAAPAVARGDVVAAYARVARAVRLTLMLQAKAVQQALDPGAALDRKDSAAKAGAPSALPDTAEGRKALVLRIVGRTAREAHANGDAVERLEREAAERLEDAEAYGDGLSRPVSEMIDRLCEDLGLDPDWDRLEQEPWARAELASGRAGAPLTEPPGTYIVQWMAPEDDAGRTGARSGSP